VSCKVFCGRSGNNEKCYWSRASATVRMLNIYISDISCRVSSNMNNSENSLNDFSLASRYWMLQCFSFRKWSKSAV